MSLGHGFLTAASAAALGGATDVDPAAATGTTEISASAKPRRTADLRRNFILVHAADHIGRYWRNCHGAGTHQTWIGPYGSTAQAALASASVPGVGRFGAVRGGGGPIVSRITRRRALTGVIVSTALVVTVLASMTATAAPSRASNRWNHVARQQSGNSVVATDLGSEPQVSRAGLEDVPPDRRVHPALHVRRRRAQG